MMTAEKKFEVKGGLIPMQVQQSTKQTTASQSEELVDRIQHICLVVKEHIIYHRALSIGVSLSLGLFVVLVVAFGSRESPTYQPKVDHDFSDLQDIYELKKTEIDHWCLGGGNDCACQDPTVPVANDGYPGWFKAHHMNKELVESASSRDLDVVFLGDDTTEEWNGRWVGESVSLDSESLLSNVIKADFPKINRLWNRTFTVSGGGSFEGLALGIYGDTTGNLLWRLQHGEMTTTLKPKVWWILIGGNDLEQGGCSEDAVILGILRVAEEIASRSKNAMVVIQGLLPRASSPDGSLFASRHTSLFHQSGPAWWPSIELINKELQRFCRKHKNFYYFDASSILLGQISNEHFTSNTKQIMSPLMPDYTHLSFLGHKVVSKQIVKKLNSLLQRGANTSSSVTNF